MLEYLCDFAFRWRVQLNQRHLTALAPQHFLTEYFVQKSISTFSLVRHGPDKDRAPWHVQSLKQNLVKVPDKGQFLLREELKAFGEAVEDHDGALLRFLLFLHHNRFLAERRLLYSVLGGSSENA